MVVAAQEQGVEGQVQEGLVEVSDLVRRTMRAVVGAERWITGAGSVQIKRASVIGVG